MTEKRKIWYNGSMVIYNETDAINERIAKNLTYYRKSVGLTQAELAEKINYSDKSVSKWESGNGVPDIYVLIQIADLFGVTVNDLVTCEENRPTPKKPSRAGSSLIMLLSTGLVWRVATAFFVLMNFIVPHKEWWLAFLYAVPVSAVVVVVLAWVFKRKKTLFVAVMLLIWSLLASIQISVTTLAGTTGGWSLYLLGVPLQILEIFWVCFRKVKRKNRLAKKSVKKES